MPYNDGFIFEGKAILLVTANLLNEIVGKGKEEKGKRKGGQRGKEKGDMLLFLVFACDSMSTYAPR